MGYGKICGFQTHFTCEPSVPCCFALWLPVSKLPVFLVEQTIMLCQLWYISKGKRAAVHKIHEHAVVCILLHAGVAQIK